MQYPTRTNIENAMKFPQISIKTEDLKGGSAVKNGTRLVQYNGGFTSVFPFHKKNNKKVAVRCWVTDIGDARTRSEAIAKYLSGINSPYFVDFKYVENAFFVNKTFYPLVIMEWVDGQVLKEYVNKHINNTPKLLSLAEEFLNMVKHLHQNKIAHGDLQHGNIIIKNNGKIILIDYDSMYIPTLQGMKEVIKGLKGYQHPTREKNVFINPKLDYFSELVIYLGLLTFAEYPSLWAKYYKTEDFLFNVEDYQSPNSSQLISMLSQSNNDKIKMLTEKLLGYLSVSSIINLEPLENIVKGKKDILDDIFGLFDNQPNPPKPKNIKTIIPNKNNIINKF